MQSEVKVVLCTIALNEMQWLYELYEQHKHWPDMVKWVFVEGTDTEYAKANPGLVTSDGLSVDGTTEFLTKLAKEDKNIVHIKHGWSDSRNPALNKCILRQRYLTYCEEIQPSFLVILDADEFWTYTNQEKLNSIVSTQLPNHKGFIFDRIDLWYPPSVESQSVLSPLNAYFNRYVTGGFWDIKSARVWRWEPNMKYISNHNSPEVAGKGLLSRKMYHIKDNGSPIFCHMGFCAYPLVRAAKNRYYEQRGEGRNDHRASYVMARKSWETWEEGDVLPDGAYLKKFDFEVPECFREVV